MSCAGAALPWCIAYLDRSADATLPPHVGHILRALTEQAWYGADAAAVQAYVKSLKDYITKNGSTKVSELGAKVKKPAGLTTKLTKAINESGAFTISKSQDVSLK